MDATPSYGYILARRPLDNCSLAYNNNTIALKSLIVAFAPISALTRVCSNGNDGKDSKGIVVGASIRKEGGSVTIAYNTLP